MRTYANEELEAVQYGRVATLWARWVDAYGFVYPQGVQDTWLHIRELADNQPGIEYAPTDHLEILLAPPPPHTTISFENSRNTVISYRRTMRMKSEVSLSG